jgi:hypothetical protein
MRLAILSRSLKAYSTRRLKEAALDRGFDVKVLDTLKFAIDLKRGEPDLYFRQKLLRTYDAVLPRIGSSITYYVTAVVRQFQEMDVFCANTAHGISNSRDKLRSLQILARHHIGIPEATFVCDKKLPLIKEALLNISQLQKHSKDKTLKKSLTTTQKLWKKRQVFMQSELQVSRLKLKDLEADEISISDASQNYIKSFFEKRGLYLTQALLFIVAFQAIFY